MQSYVYSVFSIVAIVIHLTINFKMLAGGGEAPLRGARYRSFLFGILAYYIADAAWGIFAGLGWMRAWYVDTVLFFFSLVAFALTWARFALVYVGFRSRAVRLISGVGYALLAAYAVALSVNVFNDCVFYFDGNGAYCGGPVRDWLFYFLIAFNILLSASVFAKVLTSHGSARNRNTIVFVYCTALTAVAITLQVIWPLTPFTSLGCLVGNCFLHAFVVEDENKRRHVHELASALSRARSAEKARSMFFSIVSHDIRTPLNAILGYSELLLKGVNDDSERRDALETIRSSGVTLLNLVNDVLDIAKMDAGKLEITSEPVRISSLVDEVFASFRKAAEAKGISLIGRTADVPALMLDANRFRQILFNLIGNAVKFTERGSVMVAAAYSCGNLDVAVADTGCGIPEKMLAHVFDPFVQVHDPSHSVDRANGVGLGLSICRSLAGIMGGKLTVESEFGKGATFRLRLTGVATADLPPAPSAATKGEMPIANLPRRVLVVDDSAVNRAVMAAILKKAGVAPASIDHACDGEEALAKLEEAAKSGTPHDLVITDFWMPNVNGMELVEHIRGEPGFERLPVFVVTADTEYAHDERSRLFTGALLKPLTYSKLVEVLAACGGASKRAEREAPVGVG